MVWSYEGEERTTAEGTVQRWERLMVEQVASTTAGYIRLRITSKASAIDYGNPYYSANIWSNTAKITSNGDIYTSDTAFDLRQSDGYSAWTTSSVEANVPSSAAGTSVTISGAVGSWNVPLKAVPSYELTITKGDNVSSLTVKRTATGSDWSTIATLATKAIIYKGDTLTVTATAKLGYKLKDFTTPITVSGNTTVSVEAEPQATIQLYDGTGWTPYMIYIFTGTTWELYQAYVYNGSTWEPYY